MIIYFIGGSIKKENSTTEIQIYIRQSYEMQLEK